MKRRNSMKVFLPVLVLYLIQNAASLFLSQMAMVYTALTKGPIEINDYVKECISLLMSPEYSYVFNIFTGIIGIIVFARWYRRLVLQDETEKKELKTSYQKTTELLLTIVGIVMVGFSSQFIGAYIIEIVSRMSPQSVLAYKQTLDTLGLSLYGDNLGAPLLVVAYAVLISPLMEEFVFRGVIIKSGLNSLPVWGVNIISATLFGFLHGNLLQGSYAVVFALILGYIFAKTEKLWITIAIHIVFNGISMFIPQVVQTGNNMIQSYGILLTALVVSYFGVYLIIRNNEVN